VSRHEAGGRADAIVAAAGDFERQAAQARSASRERYVIDGGIAVLTCRTGRRRSTRPSCCWRPAPAPRSRSVVDGVTVNIAASFESGLNFVTLLGLGGGMPTRVSVPASRLNDVLAKIRGALQGRSAD
jgi:hypothetical protein